jgi:MFS family permease
LINALLSETTADISNYFGPTIYKALGFGGTTTLMINGVSGAWQVVVVWVFIQFIVDRVGRRKPLIIGPILMSIFLAWQAGIASRFADPTYQNEGVGVAGLVSIFLFSGAFSASFGPVSWIYQSEIFPMNQRALGTAVSTAANWLNNVIIGQVTPYGFDKLGWKYFFVFVATNLSNAVVSFFLFPETKHKTLEEIGLLFGDTNVRTYHSPIAAESGVATGGLDDKVEFSHH